MRVRRRAITVGATFFLAAATGHLMQNGDKISSMFNGDAAAPEPVVTNPDPVVTGVEPTAAVLMPAATNAAATATAETIPDAVKPAFVLPDLPATEPQPLASVSRLADRIGTLDSGYVRPESDADVEYSVFGLACSEGKMTAEVAARSMLRVTLAAPCHPEERVTIRHAGLKFAMATDNAGDLELMLPAFMADAEITAAFGWESPLSTRVNVAGLDSLHRVAVQSADAPDLHLHAFENGSAFGGAGHVFAANPRDRMVSDGGFLTLLGDPTLEDPMLAEVYSAPVTVRVDALEVEAEVTAETCGRQISAESLRAVPDAEPVSETLRLSMPGCDALGDVVVLSLAAVAGPRLASAAD